MIQYSISWPTSHILPPLKWFGDSKTGSKVDAENTGSVVDGKENVDTDGDGIGYLSSLQRLVRSIPGPTSGIRALIDGTSDDDEASNHEDASDTGAAPKQQQRSRKMSQPANDDYYQHLSDGEASYHEDASENEYDIWAMEMEHYLEYIDNDVWKVIQNGNSKKRILTRKDDVVSILPPVSPVEIHAVEKERKARTILLTAIPKEHLRRFHGMDDAKEI
ncbi:hypothetical protein Tco_0396550 [Tanacetum coccineum]